MRIAGPLLSLALAAALLAGCGSSSSDSTAGRTEPAPAAESSTAPAGASAQACDTYAVDAKTLRASGVPCGQARQVMYGWQRAGGCSTGASSRSACEVRGWRCLSARTDRGVAVSCAGPGRSISFVARRG